MIAAPSEILITAIQKSLYQKSETIKIFSSKASYPSHELTVSQTQNI